MTDSEFSHAIVEGMRCGIAKSASAFLGFDVSKEKLTIAQAEKFHKFVEPLLVKHYERIKDDPKKVEKFKVMYENTMPDEILTYLVYQES